MIPRSQCCLRSYNHPDDITAAEAHSVLTKRPCMFMVCESLPDMREDIFECSHSFSHHTSSCFTLLHNQRLSHCTTRTLSTEPWVTLLCNVTASVISNSLKMNHVNTAWLGHFVAERLVGKISKQLLSYSVMLLTNIKDVMNLIKHRRPLHLPSYVILHFILCPQGGRAVIKKQWEVQTVILEQEGHTSSTAGLFL